MKIDFRILANSGVRELVPYQPGKPIEELERELGIKSAIKLASNENPLGPSPLAISMLTDALRNAHIYPDGACYDLKQALSTHHGIEPEQITVGNGSENVLELIVKAYLDKQDNAVISQYAFLTIPLIIKSYGVASKVVPAKDWGHDIEKMLEAMDEKTRIIFLVNPNNPTGTYTNDGDFNHLMSSVPPHVLVVVDEAYAEYIKGIDYPKTLDYLKKYPNLIVTRTFSKVYGLAALRLGYAVSSPEIADILNRARLPFNVNTIASKAACAALQDWDHVTKSIFQNQQGMQQFKEELQKLNFNFIPSVGNFITIEVGEAASVYKKLLLQGIIVRPLQAYMMLRHIRVTVGSPTENERCIKALYNLRH